MRESKKRFEGGFLESSGAASGFDEPEFTHGEDAISGVGLSFGAMRSVARRQLIGSIVVALIITAAVGMVALRPVNSNETTVLRHSFAIIQQPTFVVLPNQRIAATKREMGVP